MIVDGEYRGFIVIADEIKEDAFNAVALSRGRNLFGYNPYPDEIIEGFCRNSIRSGIDIMRIFDALMHLIFPMLVMPAWGISSWRPPG